MDTITRTFHSLPSEIIENIMSYMDSLTLISASRTCSNWNIISKKFLNDNNWWKRKCKNEIETEYIHFLKNFAEFDKDFDWRRIRMYVHRWDSIRTLTLSSKQIFSIEPHCREEIESSKKFKNTALVRVVNDGYYLGTDPEDRVLIDGDIIVSLAYITVCHLERGLFYLEPQENVEIVPNCAKISLIEEKIVYYTKRNCLFYLDLAITSDVTITRLTFNDRFANFLAKNYILGKVLALSYSENFKIYMLNEYGKILTLRENKIVEFDRYLISQYDIQHAYLFHLTIIFVTIDGSIVIGKNRILYEHTNIGHIFESYPRFIVLHGKLLLIGLDSGNMLIYSCSDIRKVNLSNYAFKVEIGDSAVRYIDVNEENDCLEIIASTARTVKKIVLETHKRQEIKQNTKVIQPRKFRVDRDLWKYDYMK